MKYFLLRFSLLLGVSGLHINLHAQVSKTSNVFIHDSIPDAGHFYWNHQSQIMVLDKGTLLPNDSILTKTRLLVSATSGAVEGQSDQNGWLRFSEDGENWTFVDTIAKEDESANSKNIFTLALFKNHSNEVFQFYLYLPQALGGSPGTTPIFLKYRSSKDGGLTWNASVMPIINGIDNPSNFRISGPLGKPTILLNDSLAFPVYYRYTGNAKAYFGLLICDKNVQSFNLRKFETISMTHPERLIEPVMTKIHDTLFVYFRSLSGKVTGSFSSNMGQSWSNPFDYSFINPSSPSDVIKDLSGEVYMVSNLNVKNRSNLFFSRIVNHSMYPLILLDRTTKKFDQVSYPSIDMDKNGSMHICYSAIGYDTITGKRFGDIKYVRIDTNAYIGKNSVPEMQYRSQYGIPIPYRSRILESVRNDSETITIEQRGQMNFISSTNNFPFKRVTTLDSSLFYSSLLRFSVDSILVSHSGGATFYNQSTGISYPFNKARGNSTLRGNAQLWVTLNGREAQVFKGTNLDTNLIFPFTGKSDAFLSAYSLVKDAFGFTGDSIYFINDMGKMFLYTNRKLSLCNTTITVSAEKFFGNSSNQPKYISSSFGQLYQSLPNMNSWISLGDTFLTTGHWNDILVRDSLTFFLASNRLNIQKGGTIFVFQNRPEKEEWLSILSLNSNMKEVYILDAFGEKIRINLGHLNLKTGLDIYSKNENRLLLYPNPVHSKLYLDIPNSKTEISFQIIDLRGNLIKQGQYCFPEGNDYLEVTDLSAGLYIMILQNGQSAKFLKN